MPFMNWTNTMSTGVDAIDKQHKKLLELINSLHDKCVAQCPRDELESAANEFYQYTLKHFATEERFMDQHNYPEYDAHIKQHMEGTMKAGEFFGDYLINSKTLDSEFLDFLKTWFTEHICTVDKRLGDFLCNQCINDKKET